MPNATYEPSALASASAPSDASRMRGVVPFSSSRDTAHAAEIGVDSDGFNAWAPDERVHSLTMWAGTVAAYFALFYSRRSPALDRLRIVVGFACVLAFPRGRRRQLKGTTCERFRTEAIEAAALRGPLR